MKKYILPLFAFAALTVSCNKNLADYNVRDLNAGHLIGNWAYDQVYDDNNPGGLDVSKIKELQDDYISFRPGKRDGLIATGTGTISQGALLFWPTKPKDIDFTWRMDPNKLNTVIIEVWDADGKLIGGNTANIDGSNFRLDIISSFRTVLVNSSPEKQFYSTSYYCHQLPW
jgi:hypothetical protein